MSTTVISAGPFGQFDTRFWAVRLAGLQLALALLTLVIQYVPGGLELFSHLVVFRPADLFSGWLQQPLTYATYQSPFDAIGRLDIFGLIFGPLFLAGVGSQVEAQVGQRSFLTLFFLPTAIGAVVTGLIGIFWPPLMGATFQGSWVASTVLTIAYARLMPDRAISLFLVLPVAGRMLELATIALLVVMSLAYGPTRLLPHWAALAATELWFRGISLSSFGDRLRRWNRERELRSRARKFTVIDGMGGKAKDDEDAPPPGGWLN